MALVQAKKHHRRFGGFWATCGSLGPNNGIQSGKASFWRTASGRLQHFAPSSPWSIFLCHLRVLFRDFGISGICLFLMPFGSNVRSRAQAFLRTGAQGRKEHIEGRGWCLMPRRLRYPRHAHAFHVRPVMSAFRASNFYVTLACPEFSYFHFGFPVKMRHVVQGDERVRERPRCVCIPQWGTCPPARRLPGRHRARVADSSEMPCAAGARCRNPPQRDRGFRRPTQIDPLRDRRLSAQIGPLGPC